MEYPISRQVTRQQARLRAKGRTDPYPMRERYVKKPPSNGKRECERRMRQVAAIAEKRTARA